MNSSHKLFHRFFSVMVAAAFAVTVVGAAGCGGSTGAGTGSSGGEVVTTGSGSSCTPQFDETTGQVTAGDGCRVNVAASVDMTSTGVGSAVPGASVNNAIQGAMDHTLKNGGRVSVDVFGSSSARALNLVDVTAAGPGEAPDLERVGTAKNLSEGMTGLLSKVYSNPASQPAKIRIALSTVHGTGTDLARVVHDQVDVSTEQDGGSAVVVVTDGINNDENDLAAMVRSGLTPKALAKKLTASADGKRADLVVLEGVGNVAPRLRARWTPLLTQKLIDTWTIACRSFGRHCVVTPDVS